MVSDLEEAEAAAAAALAAAEARLRSKPPSMEDFVPLGAAHPNPSPRSNPHAGPVPVPAPAAGTYSGPALASGDAARGILSAGSSFEDIEAQALMLQFYKTAHSSPAEGAHPFSPMPIGEASGPASGSAVGDLGSLPEGPLGGVTGRGVHREELATSPPGVQVHQGHAPAVSFSSVAKYGYAAGAEAGAWGASASGGAREGATGGAKGSGGGGGGGASGGSKGGPKDKRKKKGAMLLSSSSHREGM